MKKINQAALTIDVDWAPDWCIRMCMELFDNHHMPATFFITHRTSLLQQLDNNSLFELGIHPNLLPGSSHGSHPRDVLEHCLDLVPDARAMRTHALVQSSHFFAMVADDFPQIETDVSLLLPFHPPGLQPTDIYFGKTGRRITRLPYSFEDDVYACVPGWDWSTAPVEVLTPGLHIFDFHPVYVALNMATMEPYQLLKNRLGARPLFTATEEEFQPYINQGPGCRTYLEQMLRTIDKTRFRTISELTQKYRKHRHENRDHRPESHPVANGGILATSRL